MKRLNLSKRINIRIKSCIVLRFVVSTFGDGVCFSLEIICCGPKGAQREKSGREELGRDEVAARERPASERASERVRGDEHTTDPKRKGGLQAV